MLKKILVQPSVAAAERVFGVMDNAFQKQQDAALEETVQVLIMLGYSGAQRWK